MYQRGNLNKLRGLLPIAMLIIVCCVTRESAVAQTPP
jgi:hypothetical protein